MCQTTEAVQKSFTEWHVRQTPTDPSVATQSAQCAESQHTAAYFVIPGCSVSPADFDGDGRDHNLDQSLQVRDRCSEQTLGRVCLGGLGRLSLLGVVLFLHFCRRQSELKFEGLEQVWLAPRASRGTGERTAAATG